MQKLLLSITLFFIISVGYCQSQSVHHFKKVNFLGKDFKTESTANIDAKITMDIVPTLDNKKEYLRFLVEIDSKKIHLIGAITESEEKAKNKYSFLLKCIASNGVVSELFLIIKNKKIIVFNLYTFSTNKGIELSKLE